MVRKLKNIVWKLLNILNLGGSVQLMLLSYLKENGWFKSFKTKRSIDMNGNPIPWNTYPYINFIEERLRMDMNIFEYGGGNSTLWYAQRVKSIKSVENDKGWFEIISKKLPSNASMVYKNLEYNGEYSKEVLNGGTKYHIIIVDGRDRVNSVKHSLNKLTDDGVIVFDNSDLIDYKEAITLLKNNGFKKLDFIGMSPITAHKNSTSIFYRQKNCLEI